MTNAAIRQDYFDITNALKASEQNELAAAQAYIDAETPYISDMSSAEKLDLPKQDFSWLTMAGDPLLKNHGLLFGEEFTGNPYTGEGVKTNPVEVAEKLYAAATEGTPQKDQNPYTANTNALPKSKQNQSLYDSFSSDQQQTEKLNTALSDLPTSGGGGINLGDIIGNLFSAEGLLGIGASLLSAGALAPYAAEALGVSDTLAGVGIGAGTGATMSAAEGKNPLSGAITGGAGAAAGGIGTLEGAAVGAGSGALASTLQGQNPATGAISGGMSGAISGSSAGGRGTTSSGEPIVYAGSEDLTAPASSDPSAAAQLVTGSPTAPEISPDMSYSGNVNTAIPTTSGDTLPSTVETTSTAGDTAQFLGQTAPQISIGTVDNNTTESPSASMGGIAKGLAGASLPAVLAAIFGSQNSGSATSATSGASQGVTNSSSLTPNQDQIIWDALGEGLTPEMIMNLAEGGYFAPTNIGGERGYGHGSSFGGGFGEGKEGVTPSYAPDMGSAMSSYTPIESSGGMSGYGAGSDFGGGMDAGGDRDWSNDSRRIARDIGADFGTGG